jgi:DNA polymerase-3 subunit alpha
MIQDLTNQKDRDRVSVAGVVETLQIKRTKTGNHMGIMNFEDLTGFTKVVIWSDLLDNNIHLLKGDEPLLIKGRVKTGDNAVEIIADEIAALDALRQKRIRSVQVEIPESRVSRKLLEEIQNIAFMYPGECRLQFKLNLAQGGEMTISAHNRFNVSPCRDFLEKVEDLTGKQIEAFMDHQTN